MASRSTRLTLAFFRRPALEVAPDLLGKMLVTIRDGFRRAGRIVETEAYIGPHDLACHAAKGRTRRTEVMFGEAGRAYVYFIYGMYYCFNVVVERDGFPAAVLVRAIEPVEGLEAETRTDGPGKVCRALRITGDDNRADLRGDVVFIERGASSADINIERGPRVGVDYSGIWAQEPYRFWIRDNSHVSRARRAKSQTHSERSGS